MSEKGNLILTPEKFRAAIFDRAQSEDIGFSNYSYWKSTFRTFFKSKVTIVLVLVIVCTQVRSSKAD